MTDPERIKPPKPGTYDAESALDSALAQLDEMVSRIARPGYRSGDKLREARARLDGTPETGSVFYGQTVEEQALFESAIRKIDADRAKNAPKP